MLAGCLRGLGEELGFEPTDDEAARRSAPRSRTGPRSTDSPAALQQLKQRFKLGVITNCDDDLFAASNRRLGVEFDWVITAEQARGYKPRIENFEYAFERIDVPRERILHVAQSLFHDHVPAKALGHDDGLDRPPPGQAPAAGRRRPRTASPTRPSRTCRASRTAAAA